MPIRYVTLYWVALNPIELHILCSCVVLKMTPKHTCERLHLWGLLRWAKLLAQRVTLCSLLYTIKLVHCFEISCHAFEHTGMCLHQGCARETRNIHFFCLCPFAYVRVYTRFFKCTSFFLNRVTSFFLWGNANVLWAYNKIFSAIHRAWINTVLILEIYYFETNWDSEASTFT
jgi:hypothetical protein